MTIKLVIFLTLDFIILEILSTKNIMTENLKIGYLLFITISTILFVIAYSTVMSIKEFNKKLILRKQEKLNKK